MELHGEEGLGDMPDPFDRSIVRIAEPDLPAFWEIFGDGETVVLGSDNTTLASGKWKVESGKLPCR